MMEVDYQVLEYLMSSDFTDSMTPDEYKFLLLKFKSFYRLSLAKNEQIKYESDTLSKRLEETESLLNEHIYKLQVENAGLKDELDQIYIRKLSLGERISGKIKKINGDK